MEVEVKVLKGRYIQLTLEESDSEVICGIDYTGKPEELTAMLAYAVKTLANDLHIKYGDFIAAIHDTIKLMDEEEIKK